MVASVATSSLPHATGRMFDSDRSARPVRLSRANLDLRGGSCARFEWRAVGDDRAVRAFSSGMRQAYTARDAGTVEKCVQPVRRRGLSETMRLDTESDVLSAEGSRAACREGL